MPIDYYIIEKMIYNFYIIDVLYYKQNLTNTNFLNRINTIRNSNIDNELSIKNDKIEINIKGGKNFHEGKEYYKLIFKEEIYNELDLAIENMNTKYFKTDGLIFTPIMSKYSDPNIKIKKWKPEKI